MTVSRGPFPASALIYFVPQDRLELSKGDLSITHGSQVVTIPDCYPETATLRMHKTCEGYIQSIVICDRRKHWNEASVTKTYNTRRADGSVKNPKTLQDLAEELFEAMGETGAPDTTALPAAVYPEVRWVNAPAALELDKFCDDAGCDVVVNEYTSKIVTRGMGSSAPSLDTKRITPEYVLAPSNGPAYFRVEGGPVVVEGTIKLEAVGIETTGEIKPIDDLSYKPAGGWGKQHPLLFQGVEEIARDSALQSVYRWFRVKSMVDDTLTVPGVGTIASANQIRIKDFRAKLDGSDQPYPFVVDGKYWNRTEAYKTSDTHEPVMTPCRLDIDNNLVMFDDFVCNLSADGCFTSPELYLLTAFNVEDDNGQLYRYAYTADTQGVVQVNAPEEQTRSIKREELYELITLKYTATDTYANPNRETNLSVINAEASSWTTSMSLPYRLVRDQKTVVYEGIVPTDVDGRIAQVTYELSHLKDGVATTTVSENHEHDVYVDSQSRRVMKREALR